MIFGWVAAHHIADGRGASAGSEKEAAASH
jgi:hypothetical protein